jgi:hypothetical protein
VSIAISAVLFLTSVSQAASFSGTVVDANGAPVAGAQVFAEPGMESALLSTTAGADGAWRFENVPGDNIGVFAMAPGHAFAGLTIKSGDRADGVVIKLGSPAATSGKVVNEKGKPVQGAQIVRVGLLGDEKVGIPLSKLKPAGVEVPVSNENGQFSVPNLPAGARVALKVAHADYANESISDVAAGDDKLKVVMYGGLLVRGEVKLRQTQKNVADAIVWIRNAQPPHDTSLVKTDIAGAFAMRLKPGVYMYKAGGAGMLSPGWARLTLTGETVPPSLAIYVSGSGRIAGRVGDAKSGKGIPGAPVELVTEGNMAAVARTDANGAFSFAAMAGESYVQLDNIAGYAKPAQGAVRVQVAEGGTVALPDFWLAPTPATGVQVIDGDSTPAASVAVGLARPAQFGRTFTDAQGKALLNVAAWPDEGAAIGFAESSTAPLGALFGIKRDSADSVVQLFKLGSVTGRVIDANGNPVPGIAVAAMYDDSDVTLWRTVTNKDGVFRWDSVIPQLPHRCVALAGETMIGQTDQFSIEPAGQKALTDITVREPKPGKSLLGEKLAGQSGAGVVIYCDSAEAPMVEEALAAIKKGMGADFVSKVVPEPSPGTASAFVLNGEGVVVLETFGLPPLRSLRQ